MDTLGKLPDELKDDDVLVSFTIYHKNSCTNGGFDYILGSKEDLSSMPKDELEALIWKNTETIPVSIRLGLFKLLGYYDSTSE